MSYVAYTIRRNTDIDPIAALSAAILERVIADALQEEDSKIREDAIEYITNDKWFRIWCMGAGLYPDTVIEMFWKKLGKDAIKR